MRTLKYIFAGVAVFGFFVIIGMAGAYDLWQASVYDTGANALIGLILMLNGLAGVRVVAELERIEKEKRD